MPIEHIFVGKHDVPYGPQREQCNICSIYATLHVQLCCICPSCTTGRRDLQLGRGMFSFAVLSACTEDGNSWKLSVEYRSESHNRQGVWNLPRYWPLRAKLGAPYMILYAQHVISIAAPLWSGQTVISGTNTANGCPWQADCRIRTML